MYLQGRTDWINSLTQGVREDSQEEKEVLDLEVPSKELQCLLKWK